MSCFALITDGYFDGTRHHSRGPYTIVVDEGVIDDIRPGALPAAAFLPHADRVFRVPFVMPGLVEAHAHLFLDGAELDVKTRKRHLEASREQMIEVGHQNLRRNVHAGITLIRDAGDLHGINTHLKSELAGREGARPSLISAGRALRKAGRYGGFMAVEATDPASIVRTIHQLAPAADQLKILLTGIIDFEKAAMKGGVQFNLDEARLIVRTARELGLRTFAHCSGRDGLRIALDAGIQSIEHGFFMTRDILKAMADQGVTWVPTFAPVHFQFAHPEHGGWNDRSLDGLRTMLEQHFNHLALASELGVPILAGSDAGSYGVPHGEGLIDELLLLHRAGLSWEKVLASATSSPRRAWGCPVADIASGHRADLVALDGSPFQDPTHLRHVNLVFRGNEWFVPARQALGAPNVADPNSDTHTPLHPA